MSDASPTHKPPVVPVVLCLTVRSADDEILSCFPRPFPRTWPRCASKHASFGPGGETHVVAVLSQLAPRPGRCLFAQQINGYLRLLVIDRHGLRRIVTLSKLTPRAATRPPNVSLDVAHLDMACLFVRLAPMRHRGCRRLSAEGKDPFDTAHPWHY